MSTVSTLRLVAIMFLLSLAVPAATREEQIRGFEWEIVVQNGKTKEVKTYRTWDALESFSVGSFNCGLAPQPAQRKEFEHANWLHQQSFLSCIGKTASIGTPSQPCVKVTTDVETSDTNYFIEHVERLADGRIELVLKGSDPSAIAWHVGAKCLRD